MMKTYYVEAMKTYYVEAMKTYYAVMTLLI
jgi:hypothetical protein